MKRLSFVLVAMLFVTASFAGCFGGDGDDNDDDTNKDPPVTGNGNNNTTGDNNTTPPKVLKAPIPAYTVNMAAYDDAGEVTSNETGTTFRAVSGTEINFTLDASNSTDPDGTVEAASWIVNGPGGEFKAADKILNFGFTNLRGTDFGVYTATLKVLDNDNVLNSTTFFIVLNYKNTFVQEFGMFGAGTADCSTTPQEDEAGSAIAGGVAPGTYKIHTLKIGGNATKLNLSLAYTATSQGGQNQLTIRILPPGSGENDCGQAIATAPAGPSPVLLSAEGGLVPGDYMIRIDLVGAKVDNHTLDLELDFTAPTPTEEVAGDEEEEI